ncbi:hypothetical protein BGZ68_007973 [Mortierella alpina]|nr:hypothetical protein BGZ68_007973 [Mortierella alpina]
MEIDAIEMEEPRQLSERQLASLVGLWRLSHYRQAPWSSWSILYSPRRPNRRTRSEMISFDTTTYEALRKQQEDLLKKKQLHQHQIWQHVQDRLAEHNKVLEQEKAEKQQTELQEKSKKGKGAPADKDDTPSPIVSTASSSTVTSAGGSPEVTSPTKRSIRWGLQNNMTRRFDKTVPITLVPVPAVDKRPTKSALKVRTPPAINKPRGKRVTSITITKKSSTDTNSQTAPGTTSIRKHAVDFF